MARRMGCKAPQLSMLIGVAGIIVGYGITAFAFSANQLGALAPRDLLTSAAAVMKRLGWPPGASKWTGISPQMTKCWE